jgi:hypothetical protein
MVIDVEDRPNLVPEVIVVALSPRGLRRFVSKANCHLYNRPRHSRTPNRFNM